MRVTHDLHVHTYLSSCCADKEHQRPATVLAQARAAGVAAIGFADHLWVNPALPPSGWYRPQDATQIARLRADLAALPPGASDGVLILVGCEAETTAPGRYGITPEFAASLDFVLLACSHFHMHSFVAQPASAAPRDVAEHLLAFFRAAVTSGLATSIPHPFVPCGFMGRFRETLAAISDAELLDACGLAAAHGVALEITPAFLPPTKLREDGATWDLATPARLLSLARQAGCKFTFGTDAHKPETLERRAELLPLAAAAGITPADVLSLPPRRR